MKFKPSEEATAKLREFNEEQTDWYGYCKDGKKISGTLAQLRKGCGCEQKS